MRIAVPLCTPAVAAKAEFGFTASVVTAAVVGVPVSLWPRGTIGSAEAVAALTYPLFDAATALAETGTPR